MKTKTYDCKTCMYDGSKPHSAYWQNCQTCGSNNKSNYVHAKKTARTIEQIAAEVADRWIGMTAHGTKIGNYTASDHVSYAGDVVARLLQLEKSGNINGFYQSEFNEWTIF